MSEHFIKEIEIKNFKCFKDFKAEGFARVNLIGGKNNVGKTAFMEACFLSQSKDTPELFSKLLEIETHRNIVNKLLSRTSREEDIHSLIKNNLYIDVFVKGKGDSEESFRDYRSWDNGRVKLQLKNNAIYTYTKFTPLQVEPPSVDEETGEPIYYDNPDIYQFTDLVNQIDIALESTKKYFSLNFISPYSNSNQELENIIGQSKLDGKYDELNKYLFEVFSVSSIDSIKNKPMLKLNGEYRDLSQFGQGIKTFINIISSMLLLKDDFIFIDEIENGIHYTKLDEMWHLILKISQKNNVQVFATTHSKECIESYARVSKELEDEEITFIQLSRLEDNSIMAGIRDYEMIQYSVDDGHEVRGW